MKKVASKLLYLRKDRGLSQKQVASDLSVSQSLLSHYEKGIRECGIDFLSKAADYYDVSTDYLLGRAYEMENNQSSDLLGDESDEKLLGNGSVTANLSKKLVINSLTLIFDILNSCGKKEALSVMSFYFSLCIYKAFRMLYRTSGSNEGFFNTERDTFPYCIDSEISLTEMKLIKLLKDSSSSEPLPTITHGYLNEKYPRYASSLLNILHNVDNKIT